MKYIALIGFALILFIPPIVSIIFGGADIGKNDYKPGEFLDNWEDDECLNCGEEKEQ